MGLEQKELEEIRRLIMDSMKDAMTKLNAIQMTALLAENQALRLRLAALEQLLEQVIKNGNENR